MRSKIKIRNPQRGKIPYNYLYGLSSMLYHRLAEDDVELANESHKPGEFRHFNFSQLQLHQPYTTDDGLRFDTAHFYITSPDERFIESYSKGLLKEPGFYLGDTDLFVDSFEILSKPEISNMETLKTLSPICIKTKKKENGELKEWELYPDDGKWYENIHKNLVKRYNDFYGEEPENDDFYIKDVKNMKPKRLKIRNTWRRCSHVVFDLQASKELMNFALDAGLGEKTGMGFGCIEVLK